jgi:hypothetical protein
MVDGIVGQKMPVGKAARAWRDRPPARRQWRLFLCVRNHSLNRENDTAMKGAF